MALPAEADFALIKIGDGGGPETFSNICVQDVTVNQTANTADRFVRDCTKPGEVPTRKVKTTGKQLDVTGSGLIDTAQTAGFLTALGASGNYKIELYSDDGSDAGSLIGTFAGAFVMTADNLNIPRDTPGSAEVTLANDGAWTYTAA